MKNPDEQPQPEADDDFNTLAGSVYSEEFHHAFLEETFAEALPPKFEQTIALMRAYMDTPNQVRMRQSPATLGGVSYNGFSFTDTERAQPLEQAAAGSDDQVIYTFSLLWGNSSPEGRSIMVNYKRTVLGAEAKPIEDAPSVNVNFMYTFNLKNHLIYTAEKSVSWNSQGESDTDESPETVDSEFAGIGATSGEQLENLFVLLERAEQAITLRLRPEIDKDQ